MSRIVGLILKVVLAGCVLTSAFALTGGGFLEDEGYDLNWYTIDGGGAMFSSSGGYELSGTIGQPDAGQPMTGGEYTLTGGFWPGVGALSPGDLVLTSAASRRSHDASGTFELDTPLSGDPVTEPRMNGDVPQMVLTFSGTPAATDGSIDCGSEVVVTNGTCNATSVSGSDLIVDMTFDNNACVTIAVNHLDGLTGDTDVQVLVRQGNVNQDIHINVVDLQEVKNHIFQPVDPSNFIYDVTSDGTINVIDLQETKNNLFTSVSCP